MNVWTFSRAHIRPNPLTTIREVLNQYQDPHRFRISADTKWAHNGTRFAKSPLEACKAALKISHSIRDGDACIVERFRLNCDALLEFLNGAELKANEVQAYFFNDDKWRFIGSQILKPDFSSK